MAVRPYRMAIDLRKGTGSVPIAMPHTMNNIYFHTIHPIVKLSGFEYHPRYGQDDLSTVLSPVRRNPQTRWFALLGLVLYNALTRSDSLTSCKTQGSLLLSPCVRYWGWWASTFCSKLASASRSDKPEKPVSTPRPPRPSAESA